MISSDANFRISTIEESQVSRMARAIAIGEMCDHEFYQQCQLLHVNAHQAMIAPIEFMILGMMPYIRNMH